MTTTRLSTYVRSLGPVALAAALVVVAFQGCKLTSYDKKLTSIAVTPGSVTVASMTTQQFTATGTYNDNTTRNITAEASWTTSNNSVATVTAGLATPGQSGTVTITASLEGVSGSATLTVSNAVLQTIEVTGGNPSVANPSVANGTTIQFKATGHFDDSSTQDLTSQVTWDAGGSTSVTISNAAGSNGLASSTVRGATTATITATFGTIFGSTTLTVKDVTLQSIAVTPANGEVKQTKNLQLTATGTFSDTSTQDMTNEVTWSSSDTSIATFPSTPGLVHGVLTGTVTITATSSALLQSVSGTTPLTVLACTGAYGC